VRECSSSAVCWYRFAAPLGIDLHGTRWTGLLVLCYVGMLFQAQNVAAVTSRHVTADESPSTRRVAVNFQRY
jgi:hypothetical protein